MKELPESLKPTWRVVKVFKIIEGINLGLGLFIATPYFYLIFQKFVDSNKALFYMALFLAIYFGLIAIFEIPTGAIADTFGRVRSIVFSLIFSTLNGILLVSLFFCPNLPLVFVIAFLTRIMSALTFTLQSGTFSAWLVDSMREKAPGFGYDRLIARGYAISNISMVIGGLLGITVYLYGAPYIAFLVMALLSLGCLSYCLSSMEENQSLVFLEIRMGLLRVMCEHTIKTIKTATTLFQKNKLIQWTTIIFSGFAFFFNIIDRLWPVALGGQFGVEKWSYEWYVMILIFPIASAGASHLLAKRGDRVGVDGKSRSIVGLKNWLFGCVFISVMAALFLGAINIQKIVSFPVFLVSILLVEASYGVVKPAFESLICHYLPDEHAQERATVLSIGSALRSVLVLVFIIPSRGISDAMSPVGWMLPACLLFIIGVVSLLRINYYGKRELEKSSLPQIQEVLYDAEPVK